MDEKSKAQYAQWHALCKEYEKVRDRQRAAFCVVVSKFGAVAKGTGGNPTDAELEEFDQSSKALEEIQAKMDKFVKENA
jgi:hypothetical protein